MIPPIPYRGSPIHKTTSRPIIKATDKQKDRKTNILINYLYLPFTQPLASHSALNADNVFSSALPLV